MLNTRKDIKCHLCKDAAAQHFVERKTGMLNMANRRYCCCDKCLQKQFLIVLGEALATGGFNSIEDTLKVINISSFNDGLFSFQMFPRKRSMREMLGVGIQK